MDPSIMELTYHLQYDGVMPEGEELYQRIMMDYTVVEEDGMFICSRLIQNF